MEQMVPAPKLDGYRYEEYLRSLETVARGYELAALEIRKHADLYSASDPATFGPRDQFNAGRLAPAKLEDTLDTAAAYLRNPLQQARINVSQLLDLAPFAETLTLEQTIFETDAKVGA